MSDNAEEKMPVMLIAKFGKERITLGELDTTTTIGEVKELLSSKTGILPKRQKLIGLAIRPGVAKSLTDDVVLGNLKVKPGKKFDTATSAFAGIVHQFILMGTPEEQIFVDPRDRDDLPDVIDDFDLDFNAGSNEVSRMFLPLCSESVLEWSCRTLILLFVFLVTVASARSQGRKSQEVYRLNGGAYNESTSRRKAVASARFGSYITRFQQ
jgi:Ubiquitin family